MNRPSGFKVYSRAAEVSEKAGSGVPGFCWRARRLWDSSFAAVGPVKGFDPLFGAVYDLHLPRGVKVDIRDAEKMGLV